MELLKLKLVTVISESTLEAPILKEIKQLGAKGYTLVNAQGEGASGTRKGDWDQNRNVVIQTVCKEDVARAIMDHLYSQYNEDYAIVIYASEVETHASDKF